MKIFAGIILVLVIALFGSGCATQAIQANNDTFLAFNENDHDELLIIDCILSEGYLDHNCYPGTENREGIPVSIKPSKEPMPPLESLECLQKHGYFPIECL